MSDQHTLTRCAEQAGTTSYPALYVTHGGGPMPLLGGQPAVTEQLRSLLGYLPTTPPAAIVVISAHWEASPVRVQSSSHPPMLYDYSGFPPEAYKFKYGAAGSPDLAKDICDLLQANGVQCQLDGARGFDHGAFVPLMIMFPDATVPVLQVSLHSSLAIETHMRVGRALRPLRERNILLLGSGSSFHNMAAFFNPSEASRKASEDFHQWLRDIFESKNAEQSIEDSDRELQERFRGWKDAPGGRISHPREEHLLPLFVVAAAAGQAIPKMIETIPDNRFGHHTTASLLFS